MSAIVNVDAVEKSFGETRVLDPLSFAVEAGEIFGILGPNGSGKTTLLHMLVGLLTPTSGEITVMGSTPSDVDCRRRIGMAPDDLPLPLALTGAEFLEMHDVLRRQKRSPFGDLLIDLFGMEQALGRPLGEYSHGMKRKAQFIAAFAHDPALIVADEPQRGLDPEAAAVFEHAIDIATSATGAAVIIATHDLDHAADLCDRVAILHAGRCVAQGSPSEVASSAGEALSLRDAFLRLTGIHDRLEDARNQLAAAAGSAEGRSA
ncbi:MAG: ABC transporter ATP-binding protein [Acidimicrobiales bacterium]